MVSEPDRKKCGAQKKVTYQARLISVTLPIRVPKLRMTDGSQTTCSNWFPCGTPVVWGVGWTLFGSLNFHCSMNSGKEWCLHRFLSMGLLLGCQASQIECHVSHTVSRHSRLGVATIATWCCNNRDLVLQHYDHLMLGIAPTHLLTWLHDPS